MQEIKQAMQAFEGQLGFSLNDDAYAKFSTYSRLLVEWNEKMNLTAITQPGEIAVKHFVDSLLLLRYLQIPNGAKVCDVGTGAGFPGVPLKIARDDISLTLMDSLNKRLTFLQAVAGELGLTDTCTVHKRGEDAGRDPLYREKFDVVTARAVAHLRELSEYTLPLVKKGGCFAAMKGPSITQEAEEAKNAIARMGGKIQEIFSFTLDGAGERTIVIIKKISQTPANYPRPSAKIAKFPLN